MTDTGRSQTPEERELDSLRALAGAPRPALLGCSTIAHARLDYCAACCESWLELNGWRLLALMAATDDASEKPWWCECRYGVIGPICTHCGRTKPASDHARSAQT